VTDCAVCIDAYSVKHITYKWKDGPAESVSLAKDVQLPQVQVKGYRVKEKLEVLSTGMSFAVQWQSHTIRYDSVYLTCSKKLTGSQLPHGINKKLKCETKNIMMSVIGPVQSRYREAVQ